MSEKVVQRKNKQTPKINNNEEILVATKKRKQQQQQQQRNKSFHWRHLLKLIYLIIGLSVIFGLYKIVIGFIYVEHTNIPINLPKLVNNTISERFWGTYR
jgi:membrane protein insertase Oxa1/YidC/SpoIIIJ